MKNTFRLLLGSGCLVLASSCYTWQPPPPIKHNGSLDGPGTSRYWDGASNDPPAISNDPGAIASPNPPTDPGTPPPNVVPSPSGPTTPPPVTGPAPGDKPSGPPYGIKVNGKPGYVYSPFDKTAGIVDVQGMAPGTKVRCPYTGKIFIVP